MTHLNERTVYNFTQSEFMFACVSFLHVTAQETFDHVYSTVCKEKKVSDHPSDKNGATGEQIEGFYALATK